MNVDQGVFSSLLSKRGGSMDDVDADRRLEAEVVEEKDSFDFALGQDRSLGSGIESRKCLQHRQSAPRSTQLTFSNNFGPRDLPSHRRGKTQALAPSISQGTDAVFFKSLSEKVSIYIYHKHHKY